MENKKLISLEDFNSIIINNHSESKLNGIECPECKNELQDKNPGFVLTVHPPRVSVECKHCGYTGTRLA